MATGLSIQTDTRDPDEARIQITPAYRPHRLTVGDKLSAFRARHAKGGTSGLEVYYLSYGPATAFVDPVTFEDFVLVSQPLRGRFAVRADSGERLLSPGDPVVLDAHTVYHMRWQEDCALLNVRLSRAEFETAIAEISGTGEPAPIRFPLGRLPSKPGLMAIDQVMRFLLRDVLPTGLLASAPLVRGQLTRMLVASVLEAYTAVSDIPDSRSSGDVRPAAVRRAIVYIERRAADDIRVGDIAVAARLSTRALQEAFRKYLDTTPMRYLKSVRLARAHADLRQGSVDEGLTVAAIAYRWGFGNLGRFSVDYRREFGRSPSQVLRALR